MRAALLIVALSFAGCAWNAPPMPWVSCDDERINCVPERQPNGTTEIVKQWTPQEFVARHRRHKSYAVNKRRRAERLALESLANRRLWER